MEPSPTDRPAFELETYADQSLPHGKQLHNEDDLVGHTIKAVETCPLGEWAASTDMVIVTETLCWMVLTTNDVFSCEESASVTVQSDRQFGWDYAKNAPRHALTLHDYLGADTMLRLALCTQAEHEHLLAKEQAAAQERRAAEAKSLRDKLAKLEGGAA